MTEKQTIQEKETIRYYHEQAEQWVANRGGYSKLSCWTDEVDEFHRLLPQGKILEIGSGAGKEAALLVSKGYDYTGIDAALGLLQVAQNFNPMLSLFHMDVFDMNFADNTFDGFWCAATLLHIPKSKINEALRAIKRVIKSDGIGFISLMKGLDEVIDQETNRFFAQYILNEMSTILTENNFIIEKSYEIVGKGSSKKTREWLCFFVRIKK